jgi:amino acid permease
LIKSNDSKIIHFWTSVENVNNTAWIIPLLFALTVIQFFGVKGYGEVRDDSPEVRTCCLLE